jgi:hypothetical protein
LFAPRCLGTGGGGHGHGMEGGGARPPTVREKLSELDARFEAAEREQRGSRRAVRATDDEMVMRMPAVVWSR